MAEYGIYETQQKQGMTPQGEMGSMTAVGMFTSDKETRNAVEALKDSGIGEDYISVVGPAGKIETLDNEIQGFHTTQRRLRKGAYWGGWIGGIAGIVGAGAIFVVAPPAGAIVGVGMLASILAGAIEGAVVGAGAGILATALASMGIKEPDAKELERRVAQGELLVLVQGPQNVVARAENVLQASGAARVAEAPAGVR